MSIENPMSDDVSSNPTADRSEESSRGRFGRKAAQKADASANDNTTEAKPSRDRGTRQSRRGDTAKKERPGRGEAVKAVASDTSENRREIPVSCYDLLNGEFRISARTRTASVVLGFVVLFGVGYMGVAGVVERVGTASATRVAASLQAERTELLASFGESTGLTGVSETELLERDKTLSTSVNTAVTQQPDLGRLVVELKRLANPGIKIRSISVGENVPDPKAKEGEGEKEEDASESILKPQRVQIVAESEDFDLLINWAEQLRSLSLLNEVVFSRNGKSVQISAAFGPGTTPAAALELLQLFGSGVAVEGNQSGSTGGTTNGTPTVPAATPSASPSTSATTGVSPAFPATPTNTSPSPTANG